MGGRSISLQASKDEYYQVTVRICSIPDQAYRYITECETDRAANYVPVMERIMSVMTVESNKVL